MTKFATKKAKNSTATKTPATKYVKFRDTVTTTYWSVLEVPADATEEELRLLADRGPYATHGPSVFDPKVEVVDVPHDLLGKFVRTGGKFVYAPLDSQARIAAVNGARRSRRSRLRRTRRTTRSVRSTRN